MGTIKSKPHSSLGFVLYDKYSNWKEAEEDRLKLENNFARTYLRKIGKLGDKWQYEIWILDKKNK